jgi:predicted glutamine amidotransferase
MCGLVGMAGSIGFQEKKMFETMLELDIVRGKDSTGVVFNTEEGTYIAKALDVPYLGLYFDDTYIKGMEDKTVNLLLGHNRAATQGAISADNAHPFNFGTVYGAHNGTLSNTTQLDKPRLSVDSMSLYDHIASNGLEDALVKANGAYALTWFDSSNGTINFIRNSQRPLFWCLSSDGQTMFWASEVYFLQRAAKKARITLGTIYDLREMHHYQIALPPRVGLMSDKKFGKFRIKKSKGFQWSMYNGGSGSRFSARAAANISRLPTPTHTPSMTTKKFRAGNAFIIKHDARKPITFRVVGSEFPMNDAAYIKAYVVGDEDVEVHIAPMQGTPTWTFINQNHKYFKGRLSRFKSGYLLIKPSTVEAVAAPTSIFVPPVSKELTDLTGAAHPDHPFVGLDEPFEDIAGETYRVRDNEYVSRAEYLRLIAAGCCVCGDPVQEEDEDSLEWFMDSPVCVRCCIEDVESA